MFVGVRRNFVRIILSCPKKIQKMWPPKKSSSIWAPIVFKSKHLGSIFAQVFRELMKGFRDFDRILGFRNYASSTLCSECYDLIAKCETSADAINHNLQNVEIIAKAHQDHQGTQSHQLWHFQGGVAISGNKRPLVVWLTAPSQCLQTNDSKRLDNSCDSTRPSHDSDSESTWKKLDDSSSKGMWVW